MLSLATDTKALGIFGEDLQIDLAARAFVVQLYGLAIRAEGAPQEVREGLGALVVGTASVCVHTPTTVRGGDFVTR